MAGLGFGSGAFSARISAWPGTWRNRNLPFAFDATHSGGRTCRKSERHSSDTSTYPPAIRALEAARNREDTHPPNPSPATTSTIGPRGSSRQHFAKWRAKPPQKAAIDAPSKKATCRPASGCSRDFDSHVE
ncbi:hypothetical protein VOLCADRAFT_104968 [Volvox carteri f. nagariensis]|uniref:Uncharacterized protein n=1 Tax=Volvox carteri f. nagariensis TaxID=3068 RepID=D8TXI2_VOLCA|nr:uncharacterized protein VOLCADRAFT_104968 [Volvox carteri f. nagariensis]EFJ48013.1 hypothetical protein VOLCADRAFT_104968 [Volvox carteri f. nagariensis]|eukprot:XP_002951119.1 hypothetical protein VOLCADRAFT_104968 [Volvox carteri f. nagariensis]